MRTLLIVLHSMTGGTRQMPEAAVRGAAETEPGVGVRVLRAPEAGPADVLGADGHVFATPENLAAMSGLLKGFFDRTYYPALGRIEGRPYAALVCAGSDAARQVERICTGWRLKPVVEPLIVCTHAQTPEAILAAKAIGAQDLGRCEELGATLAAGLAMGIF